MPEPAAPVGEAAVRAEIDALRDQPYGVGETQLDRAAKTEALYRKLYPSEPTAPAAAPTGSAEEAKASIPALRAARDQQVEGSARCLELEHQLEQAYRTAYPEPSAEAGATSTTPPATSSEPLRVPPIPSELGGRYAYADAALAELGPAVAAAGIPRDEVNLWITTGLGMLASRTRMAPADVDATLAKRFGDQGAARIAEATSLLSRLTPPTRVALDRFLDESGLSDRPSFVEWLAGHGARLRRGTA